MSLRLFFLLLAVSVPVFALGQNINGQVLDMETHAPLTGVNIQNVHAGIGVVTDSMGNFLVAASKDQLLEFRKIGFKTVRVRIPMGYVPSYYKIIMKKGPIEIPGSGTDPNKYDYRSDSIRFHDIYKHELDFPKLSTLDVINHPFSALSKRNREVWAFQDDYDKTQKEKYVDREFNAERITQLTGLTGDNLRLYMRRYRPTYEELRSMSEYGFLNYIKRTGKQFIDRGSPSRNSR